MSVLVLGMVGSARPWGNSELLARQALLGAQAEGAGVRLIRLTSLNIQPCTGCMRCVIRGLPCPIDDDMTWLIETIEAADALVLSAPTYWLGPAAQVKLILDRLLMITGRVDRPLPPVRPAVTVATAGLEGWRGIALPFLNALVAGFGYRPLESLVAIGPGPGEVLMDAELMSRMWNAGRRLAHPMTNAEAPLSGGQGCPVCRCEAVVLDSDRARCPICGCEAAVEVREGKVLLQYIPGAGHPRWSPEGLRAHMVEWVQATGPSYLTHRKSIVEKRAIYRQMLVQWLSPPRPTEPAGDGPLAPGR